MTAVPLTARLLIDSRDERRPARGIAALVERLRTRILPQARRRGAFCALEIRNLQGERLLALGELRLPLDVALPPGTYHLDVQSSGQLRRYTVTLEAGASFELQLGAIAQERGG
jgi:hypothetical protein